MDFDLWGHPFTLTRENVAAVIATALLYEPNNSGNLAINYILTGERKLMKFESEKYRICLIIE